MKILAFVGSPRKGGNTDILVDELIKGAQTAGHISEKIYLYNQKVSPCIDCRKCKKDELVCVIDDDMQSIYPKIDDADLLVYGTPNYWYGPSANMKLLMDRMRPYGANKKLSGKNAVVISPAGEGPGACGPLVEMFRLSAKYLGMNYKGEVLGKAYDRGEIKNDTAAMKAAFDLGASL